MYIHFYILIQGNSINVEIQFRHFFILHIMMKNKNEPKHEKKLDSATADRVINPQHMCPINFLFYLFVIKK